jgi:hypothetical protein
MRRTGQQAVAGTASTSRVTSEPRNPGQEGLGSYHSCLAKHRTSSAGITHDQGDPVDDVDGQPSRSDDEAMDQQSDCEDESNSVDSVHQQGLASMGVSSGERVPCAGICMKLAPMPLLSCWGIARPTLRMRRSGPG